MDIKFNNISENKKEIKVTMSISEVEEYGDKAAELISSETKIDGFRPGKAPKSIIIEKFGKERVWNESCYQALNKTYTKILQESDLFIVSSPQVDINSMEIDKPFVYTITIDILPEINLPDCKKISEDILKEKKEIKVEEKEIEKTINEIQKSRAKIKNVSRGLKNNDEAVITFHGSINGVKQKELKREKISFILGEHEFIPGFSNNLIEMKSGDKKTFSVEMTTPNKNEKEKVTFEVEVHDVREREIPELNDDFAVSLGDFKSLTDLKQKIKENIKFEKEIKEREKIRVKIIEGISEKTKINIPESMIEKELDNMISEYKEQLSQSGLSFQDYLNQINKSENEIRKDWKDRAEKRIKASLILQEIARKEKIEITDEEIEKETNSYLSRVNQQEMKAADIEKLKFFIKDILQNEKVFQKLEK
jgi:trigger factor